MFDYTKIFDGCTSLQGDITWKNWNLSNTPSIVLIKNANYILYAKEHGLEINHWADDYYIAFVTKVEHPKLFDGSLD